MTVFAMTYSLFAPADGPALEERLRTAFESWIAHRENSKSRVRSFKPLSEDSAEVYRDMWLAFVPYCAARGLDLSDLETDDLDLFLVTRGAGGPDCTNPRSTSRHADLTPRYARRFLTLIDWITTHQARVAGTIPNNAAKRLLERPEYKYANAADKNALPEYLTDVQSKRLIAFVTQLPNKQANSPSLTWKEVRDRTAVAMMLGAGLTPGDVRSLTLPGVLIEGGRKAGVPWSLSLSGNGNFPARETPLASWAGRQLAYWLAVRAEQGLGGEYVFPSTRDGKQWSETRCYEGCKEVLREAGIAHDAGGLFKLRHSFALRQLTHGKSDIDVARWLGLLDINGMQKYRRILPAPVDVV